MLIGQERILKFAKQNTKEYSQIGAAVSLSVLFHAPLFGIFEVEEDPDMQMAELGKGSKIFIYGIALAAGTGSYAGLSALLGGGMSGFRHLMQLRYRESIM